MTKQPTAKQSAVLAFIGEYIGGRGYSPSVKDISKHFGFASDNAAQEHIDRLEKKGLVKRDAGIPRSLRLVAQVTV